VKVLNYYGTFTGGWKTTKQTMTQWLSRKRLAEFLAGHAIVETLLHSHDQVLQRASPILDFVADLQMLEERDLNALWVGASEGDSDRRSTVYEIIDAVTHKLPSKLIDFLFAKLTAAPAEDELGVQLLAKFTTSALQRDAEMNVPEDERRTYGMDTLWDAMQDESEVSSVVAGVAKSCLTELLQCKVHSYFFYFDCMTEYFINLIQLLMYYYYY